MLTPYRWSLGLRLILSGSVLAFGGVVFGQEFETEDAVEAAGQVEAGGQVDGGGEAEVAEGAAYPRAVEDGELRYRFPQEKDADGHLWGVTGSGGLGWSNWCLKSAMEVKVGGEAFEVDSADELERGHYVISGRAGDVEVRRDVVLDRGRGLVRYWDRFRPAEGAAGGVAVVEYLTVPLGAPAEMLTSSGRAVGKRLGDDEFGVVVRHDPGELGRTSAVLVLGARQDVVRPALVVDETPVLTVGYRLELKAGVDQGLVVVVAQRELAKGGDVKGVFRELFWRQSLFGAAIPPEGIDSVVNFPPGALSGEGVMAPHADDLIGVLDVEQRLGVERSTRDILWVSGDSQLTGDAIGGEVSLSGPSGDLKVAFADVAAMQGGAGQGRQHRLYLRDGTVLGGTLTVEGLRVAGTQGWRIEADPEQLDHLLLRLAEEDGVAPEGTGMFVKLHSGDVLPLALDGGPMLPFVTPWGAVDVPADAVEVMLYVKVPTPRYRLVLKDGSRLTGFAGAMELSGRAGILGEVRFELSSVEALWPAGETPDLEAGEFAEAESFGELEPAVDAAGDYCLLRGGNLLAGTLGGGEIHLLTGTTVTAVSAEEIVELRREEGDPGELMPEFRVELAGGHVLRGRLREEFLVVETGLRDWSVPVQHFVGARRGTGGEVQ